MAARSHLRGQGGPGRNGGTGPRGAGHRRRETPVPTSGEEVDEKTHHYDRIIGSCLETVTSHVTYLLTCVVCSLFTDAKSQRRIKAREIGDHRPISAQTNRMELVIHVRDMHALTREITALTADIERLRTDLQDVFDRFLSAHEVSKVDRSR